MWFFVLSGRQEGPVHPEKMQFLIKEGTIHRSSPVWKKGMANWVVASETELNDLFPADMPPSIPNNSWETPPPIPPNTKISHNLRPIQLLIDTFNYVGTIYIPLLAFFIPTLVFSVLQMMAISENSNSVSIALYIIDFLCVIPYVTGASIYFVYKKLIRQEVTIAASIQKSAENFIQLFLVNLMLFVIVVPALILIVPGLYLAIRTSFVYYSVIIEGRTATASLKRSWNLTEDFGKQIFLAIIVIVVVLFIPILIISLATGGNSIFISLYSILLGPVMSVYYVFIFMSLINFYSNKSNYTVKEKEYV